MEIELTKNDVLMDGTFLAGLEYGTVVERSLLEGRNATGDEAMSVNFVLNRLRENPDLALELLSCRGSIYYMGPQAGRRDAQGRTLGVRFVRRGFAVEGDNAYGRVLEAARDRYRAELAASRIEERGLRVSRDGQHNNIIVDYTPAGSFRSVVAEREAHGERFIHTDPFVAAGRGFDAALDGTTGHNRRDSDSDVEFQTFVCPFGTDYRSRVRVATAAEASLLYERGLRGEADWNAVLDDLRRRGLVMNLSRTETERLVQDLDAQFAWMRERIARDASLRSLPIVAPTLMVPDASFGCSRYDYDTAPSPAHILARYMNNPLLLYVPSENGVLRALEMEDKNEQVRFTSSEPSGYVNIVVDGSDTIGGRVPGTRAVSGTRREFVRDADGNVVYGRDRRPLVASERKVRRMQFKEQAEIEADYASFSRRLEQVVASIPPDVRINFVTGNGIGTPQMVRRFVQEHGGRVSDWDYAAGRAVEEKGSEVTGERFSQLRMSSFESVAPVLTGEAASVDVVPQGGDASSPYVFSRGDVPVSGYVVFSISSDRRKADMMLRGSMALDAGLKVVHVQDNRTEQEQQAVFAAAANAVRDEVIGERSYGESLFSGGVPVTWDVERYGSMSYVEGELALPSVSFVRGAAVVVNNISYHTVYGAYAALVMKSSGVSSPQEYAALAAGETSMGFVSSLLERYPVGDDVQERCMRNAVHMMAQSSSVFASDLLGSGDGRIAEVSSIGGSRLFVGPDGRGENRFGIVLEAERALLRAELEAERERERAQLRAEAEENARLQRRANTQRAPGQKMAAGLPAGAADAAGAVWFLGTARPLGLEMENEGVSFSHWVQTGPNDVLCREVAQREMLDGGDGTRIPNRFVFIGPTTLEVSSGREKPRNNPDARDLTGVRRINPDTGREFIAGYGIPVKRDARGFEAGNSLGRASSFLTDRDAASLFNSIVAVDALARTAAMENGCMLCYSKRERDYTGGVENDDLSRVFNDKVWDFPRTAEVIDRRTGRTVQEGGAVLPTEVSRGRVYNSAAKRYEERTEQVYQRQWVDSPHAAPRLKALVTRYENILKEGTFFPLNCICLPSRDYSGPGVTEEAFLADFGMALAVANATAVAAGVPMRFPLDAEGRLDLGPDVPQHLRDLAERRLDSFIGVVRDEDLINGVLPVIERIPISKSVGKGIKLVPDGTDFYMRPNAIMRAFGPYDFSMIESGQTAPLHEMAFRDADGVIYRITEPRLTRSMQLGEINRYLRYDRNDECRFVVTSTDPDRIPSFVQAFKSYIERARRVSVETRLLREGESGADGLGLEGFLHLPSSNASGDSPTWTSVKIVEGEEKVRVEHIEGSISDKAAPVMRDEGEQGEYLGKVDARDGFDGWVQCRYTLPDGTRSEWVVVKDREVALDVAYTGINRVYRSDVRVLPSAKVLEAELTSYAIRDAGELFRTLEQQAVPVKEDLKVVDAPSAARETAYEASVAESPASQEKVDGGILFTRSEGRYQQRTYENANADDVDFTFAFAVDFTTVGERSTAKAAGDSLVSVDLPLKKGRLDVSASGVAAAVKAITDALPDEYIKGEPFGVNLAGNGMSTLAASGVTQEDLDVFVAAVFATLKDRGVNVSSLRSGGQTGVDQSVALAAKAIGVQATVHAPSDWSFRDASGRDSRGGEQAFKDRFTQVGADAVKKVHKLSASAAKALSREYSAERQPALTRSI